MGLDMYAFKTKMQISNPIDFQTEFLKDKEQIAYWRKFNNLHGWMERLYNSKGGQHEFNCIPVLLTAEDLNQLKQDTHAKMNLGPTPGFFFGATMPLNDEDQKEILDFIKIAEEAIATGYQVYYTSWW